MGGGGGGGGGVRGWLWVLSLLSFIKHVFLESDGIVVFQTATSVSNFEVRGDQLVVGENSVRIIFVSSSGATRTITYTVRKTQSQGLLTWSRKLKNRKVMVQEFCTLAP